MNRFARELTVKYGIKAGQLKLYTLSRKKKPKLGIIQAYIYMVSVSY